MFKHPISAFVRLIPTLLWLVVVAVGVGSVVAMKSVAPKPGVQKTIVDELFPYSFFLLAIYGLWKAYKEFTEVRPELQADKPIRISWPAMRKPRPHVPTRYPLSDPLQANVRILLSKAEEGGILRPGEIAAEEVISRAETYDEFESFEFGELMHVLHALNEEREPRLANLAFFTIQVEVDKGYIAEMVTETARLAEASNRLSNVRLKSIAGGEINLASNGEFPEPNAKVEFEFDGVSHSVPFVMYAKNPPIGLLEEVTKIIVQKLPGKRFVSGFWDVVILALIDIEKAPELERHFPDQFEPYPVR